MLYGCKELCPGIPQNMIWDAKCPRFFQVIKFDITENACKDFQFSAVGRNIHKSRIPLNWSVTARYS